MTAGVCMCCAIYRNILLQPTPKAPQPAAALLIVVTGSPSREWVSFPNQKILLVLLFPFPFLNCQLQCGTWLMLQETTGLNIDSHLLMAVLAPQGVGMTVVDTLCVCLIVYKNCTIAMEDMHLQLHCSMYASTHMISNNTSHIQCIRMYTKTQYYTQRNTKESMYVHLCVCQLFAGQANNGQLRSKEDDVMNQAATHKEQVGNGREVPHNISSNQKCKQEDHILYIVTLDNGVWWWWQGLWNYE